jgi:hypothetical protein
MGALSMTGPQMKAPAAVMPYTGAPAIPQNTGQVLSMQGGELAQQGYSPQQIQAMQAPYVQQQSNPGGIQFAPYTPGWNSSEAQAPKYQAMVDANSSGFNAEKAEALGPGQTGWATKQQLLLNQQALNQKDAGAQQVGSQTATADDALAAQGGLSSGARERVAEGGAKAGIGMEQGINQGLATNTLSLGATDEANKLSMLGSVANQEQQRAQNWEGVNASDIANQSAEAARLNAYTQNNANQSNAAYAAAQTANAISASGNSNPLSMSNLNLPNWAIPAGVAGLGALVF